MRRRAGYHVGGEQLPLIKPDSSWTRPTELPDLRRAGVIAEDLETRDPGLARGRGPSWPFPGLHGGHVCGVSVAWMDGQQPRSIYVPTRHPETDNFPEEQVARWLTDLHRTPDLRVCFHNGASYDLGWNLCGLGVPPPVRLDDTVAMAVMVDENRLSYALDDLCKWRGVRGKDEDLLRQAGVCYGYDDPKSDLWRLPARYVGGYAGRDAEATLELMHSLEPTLDAEGTRAAYELEMDLAPMTTEMRRRGVRVNLERAEQYARELEGRRDENLRQITELLSHRTTLEDVRSPLWCERVFTELKIPFERTEKSGQGSFRRSWMLKYEGHPLPALIARAEQAEEMASKFVRGMIMGYAHDGRVHACVNQFRSEEGGTRSHRFSYADPGLQQAPNRDEEMAEVFRGSFEPEPGEVWCALDYSQQEYRMIVHFAALHGCRGAEGAVARYVGDPSTDFHAYVAEITGLERKPAKDSNFAKAFGAGVLKFASMIGKSRDEARAIYDQYDRELPFVSELNRRCERAAQQHGRVTLIDGALCHFEQWELAWREDGEAWQAPAHGEEEARRRWPERRIKRAFAHKAMNRKIQGSAARQTKLWMRECWREGIVPLLQMHDELDFSVADEAQATRAAQIGREVVTLRVPMLVDAEYGPTWGAARRQKSGYGATWSEAAALRHTLYT